MTLYALGDVEPQIHPGAFVHPDAVVIGAVRIGAESTIWPTAVLRGDHGVIEIGARTSIQDGTVLHTTADWPTVVGDECVVGHNAHLEGCRVGARSLVGSGSIVLNRAVIEPGGAVGAGALVIEGAVVATGQIVLGVPGRCRRAPAGLAGWIEHAAVEYVDSGRRYRAELRRLD